MRVALAPQEIAGFYSTLKRGFDEIGTYAQPVWFFDHPFAYGRSDGPVVLRVARTFWNRYLVAKRLPIRIFWALAALPWRIAVFVWAIFRFDAFVFACGESFLKLLDLPILKALGKRMVFVFHGSDLRPPYINCAVYRQTSDPDTLAKKARAMKRRVRWIERHADMIVTHPIWSHFLERPFVPFSRIGQTSPPPGRAIANRPSGPEGVRILHAPSDPICKGSATVREAVDAVRRKGVRIDYVEMVGEPNPKVISEILRADIVVDQVISDIRVAGLANEATWLGTVVVVAGYAKSALDSYADCELIPPTVYCEPDELVTVLWRLATDPIERQRVAGEAQRFAHENWAPHLMAQRTVKIIQGDIPSDWMCDPRRIDYPWGYGLTKSQVSEIVGALIRRGGTSSLCVDDKPHLVRRFCEIAGVPQPPGATTPPAE